jgi:sirohydrochlorin ferrochelatase
MVVLLLACGGGSALRVKEVTRMDLLAWLLVCALSPLAGMLLVRFLTVHPLKMASALFGTCVTAFILIVVVVTGLDGAQLVIACALSLTLALAGYAGMTHVVLSREDPRPLPKITRARNDPGLGHAAVVYFTHGEPETYDPIGWINQFREFDEQGVRFVPLLIRPLFLYGLRRKYLQVGRSDHRRTHSEMLKSLRSAFEEEGDRTTQFYLCFLDDHPRPDAAVIQALNEGASKIILSEVFLTISNHTAEGKALVDALDLSDYDVPVVYTGPLYDSRTLQGMFVKRASEHIGDVEKSRAGVLLVGHGQPAEWDEAWPTETEQEIGFREDVLDLFEADGYRRENLALAWMEFREPRPAEKVQEFLANGVEKVMYFAAAISADSIHSQHDIPDLVNEARVPDGFPLENLGAWNNDPMVIQAIKEKIDGQDGPG